MVRIRPSGPPRVIIKVSHPSLDLIDRERAFHTHVKKMAKMSESKNGKKARQQLRAQGKRLRASFRLYEQEKRRQAAEGIEKRPLFSISRTVELVNQTNDSWREEKSKLLFMTALGLTPTLNFKGVSSLEVQMPILPTSVLQKAKEKYAKEQAEFQAKQKAEKRKLRLLHFERIKKIRLANSKSPLDATPVEVINLSSDSEDEEDNKGMCNSSDRSTTVGRIDVDLRAYPNLTIEKIPRKSISPSRRGPLRTTKSHRSPPKTSSTTPQVVLRLGQSNQNATRLLNGIPYKPGPRLTVEREVG